MFLFLKRYYRFSVVFGAAYCLCSHYSPDLYLTGDEMPAYLKGCMAIVEQRVIFNRMRYAAPCRNWALRYLGFFLSLFQVFISFSQRAWFVFFNACRSAFHIAPYFTASILLQDLCAVISNHLCYSWGFMCWSRAYSESRIFGIQSGVTSESDTKTSWNVRFMQSVSRWLRLAES